ncbi:MAG TPA: Arc family DNA-binding protein [bacterium]|nr:Arc family DNA-binding protein [bacterium]
MKSLTLRNNPEPTYLSLQRQAEAHHRSLNQEIISILENVAGVPLYRRPDADRVLVEVREMRKEFKGSLTLREMDKAKRSGRA